MRRAIIPQCYILTLLRKHPKTLHDDDPRLADVTHVLAGGSYSDRLICTASCASIMSLSAPPFRRDLPLPRSAKLNSLPAASAFNTCTPSRMQLEEGMTGWEGILYHGPAGYIRL